MGLDPNNQNFFCPASSLAPGWVIGLVAAAILLVTALGVLK
jgi:hypothetical protein